MLNNKEELLKDLKMRLDDKILEISNYELLCKLINKAETLDEAIMIAELGTTYKRTGFHFDKRLEKQSDTIRYFKKNDSLSFIENSDKRSHKLIIGDNYPALLNLLIEFKNDIQIIYIDPPYSKDKMGSFAKTNYENSITRDNLLSMLYPRLILAKQLLAEGGVIFTSIDEKNYAYLKCLYDEVFGESNFIATYLWKKTDTPPALSTKIRKKHEYVLCYGKNVNSSWKFSQGAIDGGDAPLLNGSNPIKDITFPAGSVKFNLPDGTYSSSKDKKIQLVNDVIVENGLNKNSFKAIGRWKWAQENLNKEVSEGTYFLIKSSKFSVRYQKINNTNVKVPQSNLDSELGVGTNEEGDKELKSIFNDQVFLNPKPVSLIKFLIKMVNTEDDVNILDFFAGSGTTGQAVAELNREDGGSRRCILCTNNEITDLNPNGIAYDVTSKRLKRTFTGSCYDSSTDFSWLEKNEPFNENLEVIEIETVANFEGTNSKTPFDLIDETLYGQEKFIDLKEKIEWVCNNFEHTQRMLED